MLSSEKNSFVPMSDKSDEAKAVANFGGRLCFAVSLGRDSAVMLHMMSKLTDLKKHYCFYWSQYPEILPYQERYLSIVERLYGIRVNVFLWPDLLKVKQADAVRGILEREGCSLACFAYRMDESLQRRGMLKSLTDGIDRKRKWAYPLRSFTRKSVRAYCQSNGVPLNIEYKIGLPHDMLTHRGCNALILRHFISEEDYQAAIRQDPNVEIDYVRLINDRETFTKIFGDKEQGIAGISKGFRCPNPPPGYKG